jgi:hypothetical protein
MMTRLRLRDNIKLDVMEQDLMAYDNTQGLTALVVVLRAEGSSVRELCLSVR